MGKMYYEYQFLVEFRIPERNIAFNPYSLDIFTKSCNYFENFIPMYKMTCKIQDKDLKYFRMLDREISCFVKIMRFYGSHRDSLDQKELVGEYDFAVFYDKEDIPSYMASAKEVNESIEKPTDKYLVDNIGQNNPTPMNFSLLLKKDLKMRTFVHNYIFGKEDSTDATPMAAAVACMVKNPYVEKFLVDPPDNTHSYLNLIVPQNDIKNAIKGIQTTYGIYGKSLLLFYDNGMMYMLNKFESRHAKIKDEYSLIYAKLDERTDKANPVDCAVINDNDQFIGYERVTKVFKEDYEAINGSLKGEQFVFANYGTVINSMFGNEGDTTFVSPLNTIESPRSSRKDVGTKIITDYDMLNNAFNMSSYVHEQKEGVPISFNLTAVNGEHFKPNVNVHVTCDQPENNKLYSGVYNIKSVDFMYTNVGNPNRRFQCFCHALVTLTNKQEGFDKDYGVGEVKGE